MLKIFNKSAAAIPNICRLLADGAIVALPTETAYGLAADATNNQAIQAVVRIKGRGPNKPIALLAANLSMVKKFFRPTRLEIKLMKKFWPGPLTILLKPKYKFSKYIIGPNKLVGVRVPGDKWLVKLLVNYGKPLTATSANLSGQTTLYAASMVKKSLNKKNLRYLVDAGPLVKKPTSTIVRLKKGKIEIIRPGAIPAKKIINMVS